MKAFSTTIDINAAPQTVWNILTDAPSYTEWDPNMLTLEGNIAAGEKLVIHTKIAPNQAFTPTVAVFEPNKRMEWKSGMPFGLFDGTRTFTLEPIGENGTRFSVREEFKGLMMPLIGGTIPDLQPTFDAFAEALKTRAEAQSV